MAKENGFEVIEPEMVEMVSGRKLSDCELIK